MQLLRHVTCKAVSSIGLQKKGRNQPLLFGDKYMLSKGNTQPKVFFFRKLASVQFRHELVRARGERRAEQQNRRPELLKAFQLQRQAFLVDFTGRRRPCAAAWVEGRADGCVSPRAHAHLTTSWPHIAVDGHRAEDEWDRPWG